MGAVSRWRVELPPENNYFDPETLTDAVLHINYTAREGGGILREAAAAAARCKLPGDGWCFFDIRHDFPDAWELFRRPCRDERRQAELSICLRRKFFPFLPRDPEIRIVRIALLFETEQMGDRTCPEFEGCPCPESKMAAAHMARFVGRDDRHGRKPEEKAFRCFSTSEWPRLYSGMVDVELPLPRRESDGCEISLGLSHPPDEIRRAFLMCQYEVVEDCCSMQRGDAQRQQDTRVLSNVQ
jgi:hypothetical protein